jgi:hypothetical protein
MHHESIDPREFQTAPNISLNLYHGSSWKTLAGAAFIGIIVQLGVVAYSGLVTFHPGLRTRIPPYSKETPHLAKLGFILVASGTVLLSLGLITVCNIIETSTSEKEWRVNDQRKELRVMWLQREQSVGDHQFDATVLFARKDKYAVLTSKRSQRLANRIERDQQSLDMMEAEHSIWKQVAYDQTEWATFLSTVAALAGFGLQFQGFRYVNWSCSLVQLAAILAMTLIRALLRRGLIARPKAFNVAHTKHEIDRLTHQLASDHDYFGLSGTANIHEHEFSRSEPWTTTYAYHGNLKEKCIFGRLRDSNDFRYELALDRNIIERRDYGYKALAIRNRLRVLTKWEGPMTVFAETLAAAIKLVLDRLVKDGHSFSWVLDLPGCERIVQYRIIIERQAPVGTNWLCKDLAISLESVLSIWLCHIKDERRITQDMENSSSSNIQPRSWLVLGPEMGHRLQNDLFWFPGSGFFLTDTDLIVSPYKKGEMTLGIRGVRCYDKSTGMIGCK